MPPNGIDLSARLEKITKPWSPEVVATLNDYEVKVVKLRGEFPWHRHADTDELFLVLSGRLIIDVADGEVQLGPGQLYVVPRGVEHRPRAAEEVQAVLIEPSGVTNTGDARAPD